MSHVKGNAPRSCPIPSLEKPFSLEASDERMIKKIMAGNAATPSEKVTTQAKASSRGRDPSNDTKLSAVAAQISQKSTSQKVWDAMPWGAVVGLALAAVGGIVMLIGVTLFNAYPMWDRGDHTMSSFGGYAGLVGLVLLFDVRFSATGPFLAPSWLCVCPNMRAACLRRFSPSSVASHSSTPCTCQ